MLGVYPSALHVRWVLPDRRVVGALAVDDEPSVFWDGADAGERIEAWKAAVGWSDAWGHVGPAGGNGSSGRHVVTHVLDPLGVSASATWFTDCLPTYFVKNGPGSQGDRLQTVYRDFAARYELPPALLPARPTPAELVRRAVADEAPALVDQLVSADCSRVVTLGQEAADVLAAIAGVERVLLRPDPDYGRPRPVVVAGRGWEWIPLTHPGNRTPAWKARHGQWAEALP